MYYLGIGVHKRDSSIAVLDDDGEVVEEVRVANANLDGITTHYADSKAAIEAPSNYSTIYDTLDEYPNVVVADPYQTKAIGITEVKNDLLDAKLRRAGMISESCVPPEEIWERRAPMRGRKRLIENRTDSKKEVHGVLDHHRIEYSWDPFGREGQEILAI